MCVHWAWAVAGGRGICRDSVTYYFSCCSRFFCAGACWMLSNEVVKRLGKKLFCGPLAEIHAYKNGKVGISFIKDKPNGWTCRAAGQPGSRAAYKRAKE